MPSQRPFHVSVVRKKTFFARDVCGGAVYCRILLFERYILYFKRLNNLFTNPGEGEGDFMPLMLTKGGLHCFILPFAFWILNLVHLTKLIIMDYQE